MSTKFLSAAAVIAGALCLSACSDDMSRPIGSSRGGADELTAASRPPLSMPPSFRPASASPAAMTASPAAPGPGNIAAVSPGQSALLAASGQAAPTGIRTTVDADAQLIDMGEGFSDRLMSWRPDQASSIIFKQNSPGILDRLF